jgi:hypothetical protein
VQAGLMFESFHQLGMVSQLLNQQLFFCAQLFGCVKAGQDRLPNLKMSFSLNSCTGISFLLVMDV